MTTYSTDQMLELVQRERALRTECDRLRRELAEAEEACGEYFKPPVDTLIGAIRNLRQIVTMASGLRAVNAQDQATMKAWLATLEAQRDEERARVQIVNEAKDHWRGRALTAEGERSILKAALDMASTEVTRLRGV